VGEAAKPSGEAEAMTVRKQMIGESERNFKHVLFMVSHYVKNNVHSAQGWLHKSDVTISLVLSCMPCNNSLFAVGKVRQFATVYSQSALLNSNPRGSIHHNNIWFRVVI
jgi:hypothetical protein